MITVAFVIAAAFLVVLLALMYFSFVADGYTAPHSLSDSFKRYAQAFFVALAITALLNLLRFKLAVEKWEWAALVGIAIAIGFWVIVDLIAVGRRRRDTE